MITQEENDRLTRLVRARPWRIDAPLVASNRWRFGTAQTSDQGNPPLGRRLGSL